LDKCKFAQWSVKFLGHIVSVDGIRTNPDKVRAITEFPTPSNVDDVRRFLGMVGYYRRFIEHFAHKDVPLYELLKVSSRWRWTTVEQVAFEA